MQTSDTLQTSQEDYSAEKLKRDPDEFSDESDSLKSFVELDFDAAARALPLFAQNQEIHLPEKRQHVFKILSSVNQRFFSSEQSLLDHFSIATFSLADFVSDILVYGQAGSKDVLNQLNSFGIGIGTSFLESKSGMTLVRQAFREKKSVWQVGQENFYDFLKDYAVYVNYLEENVLSFSRLSYFRVSVIPLTHFSDLTRNHIEFSASIRSFVSAPSSLPQIIIKDKAFEDLLTRIEVAVLITNKHHDIIDASIQCGHLLGQGYLDCCGQKFYDAIPELRPLFDQYSETKKQVKKTIRLTNGSEINAEFEPCFKNGKMIGSIIYASNTNRTNRSSQTAFNSMANYTFDSILGRTEVMLTLKETAKRIALGTSNILIEGEEGCGKEILAHAIHNASPRKGKPFVVVNCGALMDSMVESILFGEVEKASPYGQKSESVGKIEQARGGTLFLRDIDRLPLSTQLILASVLRTGKLSRKGCVKEHSVNVRVIASSKKNLQSMTHQGAFMPELFYRLNIISLNVPPLRDRLEDLPLLVRQFVKNLNVLLKMNITGISTRVMNCMHAYSWPGNISELHNVIEQAMSLETSSKISYESLPVSIRNFEVEKKAADCSEDGLFRSFEETELHRIKTLMKKYNGNKSKVAEELGITRSTLYRKLNRITDWD